MNEGTVTQVTYHARDERFNKKVSRNFLRNNSYDIKMT